MSEKRMSRELEAVEAALASLVPAPSGVDRDRMMYQAGLASVEKVSARRRRRAEWLWPCATAASALLAVTFAALWLSGARPGPGEPAVAVGSHDSADVDRRPERQPGPIDEDLETGPPRKEWRTDYLDLRRLVMNQGVDALPGPGSSRASEADTPGWHSRHRDMLQQLLEG